METRNLPIFITVLSSLLDDNIRELVHWQLGTVKVPVTRPANGGGDMQFIRFRVEEQGGHTRSIGATVGHSLDTHAEDISVDVVLSSWFDVHGDEVLLLHDWDESHVCVSYWSHRYMRMDR